MSRNSFGGLGLVLCLLIGSEARADLLAYEPFDYPGVGSDVQGNSGGFGFSGPWAPGGFNASISDNYDVAAGSLSFATLLTSGNRASSAPVAGIAGLTRNFASPIGAIGQTRYYSFVLRPEGTVSFSGFFGVNLETPDEPELFAGKPGGGLTSRYVIEDRGGSNQHASVVPVVVDQTALLVVKAEFLDLVDRFTLYVNPLPGGPEPLVGTLKFDSNLSTVSGFTLYSGGGFSVDELRLGETFADVTPAVPEPSSAVILLVAGAMGLRRR
jgi:hypothetical protein